MTDSYPDLISNSFSFKSPQTQRHLSPSPSSPERRHPSSFRTPWSMPFLSWYVTKVTYETPLPPTPDHFITAVLGLMALQLGEINQAQSTLQSVLRSAGAGCERREGTEPEQAYHWNRFLGDLDSFRLQALMIKRAFFFFTTAHPSSPRPLFISLSLLFLGLLQDSTPELISQGRHLVLLRAAVRALTIRLWIISLEHCFPLPRTLRLIHLPLLRLQLSPAKAPHHTHTYLPHYLAQAYHTHPSLADYTTAFK